MIHFGHQMKRNGVWVKWICESNPYSLHDTHSYAEYSVLLSVPVIRMGNIKYDRRRWALVGRRAYERTCQTVGKIKEIKYLRLSMDGRCILSPKDPSKFVHVSRL